MGLPITSMFLAVAPVSMNKYISGRTIIPYNSKKVLCSMIVVFPLQTYTRIFSTIYMRTSPFILICIQQIWPRR